MATKEARSSSRPAVSLPGASGGALLDARGAADRRAHLPPQGQQRSLLLGAGRLGARSPADCPPTVFEPIGHSDRPGARSGKRRLLRAVFHAGRRDCSEQAKWAELLRTRRRWIADDPRGCRRMAHPRNGAGAPSAAGRSASTALERATRIAPRHAQAWYELARPASRSGMREAAGRAREALWPRQRACRSPARCTVHDSKAPPADRPARRPPLMTVRTCPARSQNRSSRPRRAWMRSGGSARRCPGARHGRSCAWPARQRSPPAADPSQFPEAERQLFVRPHLAAVSPPTRLHYRYERTGTLQPQVTDQATLTLTTQDGAPQLRRWTSCRTIAGWSCPDRLRRAESDHPALPRTRSAAAEAI